MPRNTKENAELTRQHLLKVAQKLFADQGIGNTSLDQIAKTANVTRGAVYWHFRDKNHLLTEIYKLITPIMQEYRAKLISEAQTDPALALWRHLHRLLNKINEDEMTRSITCIILLRTEGNLAAASSTTRLDTDRQKSLLRAYISILGQAVEQGQIQPDTNLTHVALGLQTLTRGVSSMMLSHPHYFNDNCQGTDLIAPYFRGILTPATWLAIKDDKNY